MSCPPRGPSPSVGAELDEIAAAVGGVAEAFRADGHRLYLVGGVVRDLFAGSFRAIDDIDLTTDAHPREIKALVGPVASALWSQGERFGTIGATVNGRDIEITTHRAEVYDDASRKPIVSFGDSIEEDLARRDFTINAMAISLPDGALIDPHGGREDLVRRVLRTPLAPEVSFTDDPLRMLRAARFLPRFDLEPEPALVEAATRLAGRLAIVSVERVRAELERLLAVLDPARGLSFLDRVGLLADVLPGSSLASTPLQVRSRALALASAPGSLLVRRAGLLWPLPPGEPAAVLQALRYSRADAAATLALLDAVPHTLPVPADVELRVGSDPDGETGHEVDAEMVRRVVARLGLDRIDDLARLSGNIRRTAPSTGGRDSGSEAGDPAAGSGPFFERLGELAATEDLGDLTSPLSGGQLIARFGLEPGPEIGRAIAHLRERRLVDGPMSESEAYGAVEAWLAGR